MAASVQTEKFWGEIFRSLLIARYFLLVARYFLLVARQEILKDFF